jgi:hypothetical protein
MDFNRGTDIFMNNNLAPGEFQTFSTDLSNPGAGARVIGGAYIPGGPDSSSEEDDDDDEDDDNDDDDDDEEDSDDEEEEDFSGSEDNSRHAAGRKADIAKANKRTTAIFHNYNTLQEILGKYEELIRQR